MVLFSSRVAFAIIKIKVLEYLMFIAEKNILHKKGTRKALGKTEKETNKNYL